MAHLDSSSRQSLTHRSRPPRVREIQRSAGPLRNERQTLLHVYIGDEDDEAGDYLLTRLGPRKTRLDMRFIEHYKIRNAPTRAQDTKHTHEIWDKIVAALERDYANRK